jgi:hypothetical protein
MINFLSYLKEGGNVNITGSNGKSYEANKIDIIKIDREEFSKHVIDSLKLLNGKLKLWSDSVFSSKSFLSGSANHLFDLELTDDKLKKIKPTFGDIDLMAPKDKESDIAEFLKSNISKTFGNLKLIGSKKSGLQFITLWDYKSEFNIQIDFELVEFENEEPTKWAKFSHSSSIDDLNLGIKGVFHKKLINAITAKNLKKLKIKSGNKIENKLSTELAFSVTYGLRKKFKTSIENNEKIFHLQAAKNSAYITDANEILKMIFSTKDSHKFSAHELKLCESFVGLIQLIKKYETDKLFLQNITDAFIHSLINDDAQKLYRGINGKYQDKIEKLTAINYLCEKLNTNFSHEWKNIMEKYYENYK